jgi:hypothetical protein
VKPRIATPTRATIDSGAREQTGYLERTGPDPSRRTSLICCIDTGFRRSASNPASRHA